VPHGEKAVRPRHLVLDALHLGAAELHHLAAVRAHQVLVAALVAEQVLVALEAVAKVVVLHQPAAHQDLHRPVDRRLADALAAALELGLDLLHRQVLLAGKHDVGHDLALQRDRQPLLAQVAPEEVQVRRRGDALFDGGHSGPRGIGIRGRNVH
jgi:hypothetical protein